ncbi:uncharacterized protein BO97DRAFT_440431 [Aspergillus homomorphus CBS 101889]|uniref:MFS general substrate transporter n=1 Tax=Aspergillus homomorphus (strain CBS 101889) TaxID=1450537 RepID=A0A395I974_ASPHC|nr:hypothetical protein BO97DRAFT_440431 [Aspergillus homomorphus CBS 101889]RAL15783.1 hypothetical protein BO97DRAFT_440431 [Aspergillus homomorphus CBS 101889]
MTSRVGQKKAASEETTAASEGCNGLLVKTRASCRVSRTDQFCPPSSSLSEHKQHDERASSMQASKITRHDNNTFRSSSYTAEHASSGIQHMKRALGLSERSRYLPGSLHGGPTSNSDTAYLSLEEAFLLRHFAQNLAQWFDSNDRDRHFALHVPERAMFCSVLRYAIYTASAGLLTRLASCGKPVESLGIPKEVQLLLNAETAIRYHDICISYLIEISHDPDEEYSEDFLTVATILRFYERIEAPSICDSGTYLNAIQFNVNTQRDESFYAWKYGVLSSTNAPSGYQYLQTNDFVWANRILVWVAGLLTFCFGDSHCSGAEERTQRWSALKSVEQRCKEATPPAFRQIHYREPGPTAGEYFPENWHMNSWQVVGAQHFELGRILLAVSDPRRASRLGIGASARNKTLADELQDCAWRDLHEAHRQAPILRTGPNSLSFGDTQAIKDIYGHSTPCVKDLNDVILGGSHTHLFDVVDKSGHAHQRKTLSAAFAIKNLELWEFKVVQTTKRLLKAIDAHCTAPMPPGQAMPDPVDVTLDFNKWVHLFTIEPINNIALSSTMDLLDKGTDVVTAQKRGGTLYEARMKQESSDCPSGHTRLCMRGKSSRQLPGRRWIALKDDSSSNKEKAIRDEFVNDNSLELLSTEVKYDNGQLRDLMRSPNSPECSPDNAHYGFNTALMTAMLELSAFIGCLFFPPVADRICISRKWDLTVAAVFFVVGAIIQAAAPDYATLVAGRFIGSIGCITKRLFLAC